HLSPRSQYAARDTGPETSGPGRPAARPHHSRRPPGPATRVPPPYSRVPRPYPVSAHPARLARHAQWLVENRDGAEREAGHADRTGRGGAAYPPGYRAVGAGPGRRRLAGLRVGVARRRLDDRHLVPG